MKILDIFDWADVWFVWVIYLVLVGYINISIFSSNRIDILKKFNYTQLKILSIVITLILFFIAAAIASNYGSVRPIKF